MYKRVKKRTPWIILIILLVVGAAFWFRDGGPPANRYSELGAGVLGGAVVAGVVLYAERVFARESEKRSNRITFCLNPDLSNLTLEGGDLSNFHLPDKNLFGAKLKGADLRRTNLERAVLSGAELEGADLTEANLEEASCAAKFEDGSKKHYLGAKHASDKRYPGAKYDSKKRYPEAKYDSKKRYPSTNFNRAILRNTSLIRANLTGTTLIGADLTDAKLAGATLYSADLQEAKGLKQEQIEQAYGNYTTKLPDNVKRPSFWQLTKEDFLIPKEEYSANELHKLSLRVNNSEWHFEYQNAKTLCIAYRPIKGSLLSFLNVGQVFDFSKHSGVGVSEAPKDAKSMIDWLRSNPYLKVGEEFPYKVGGANARRLDVVVDTSKNFPSTQGIPLFPLEDQNWFGVFKEDKSRIIAADIGNKTALIFIESRAENFDIFLSKAEEVLDNVSWEDFQPNRIASGANKPQGEL